MFEIAKTLLEEPDKIWKFGIQLFKGILNLIFSAKIYVWAFGPFVLLDLTSYNSWVEFTLTGRVLICIMLFIVSDLFLFSFIPVIVFAILDWLSKREIKKFKINKKEGLRLMKLLGYFELFIVDEKAKKLRFSKHTEKLFLFVEAMKAKESKEELDSIKQAFLTKILNSYFAFAFLYFIFLSNDFKSNVFYSIIIAGCVLLPILYIIIRVAIDLLVKFAPKISFVLKGVLLEKKCDDILENIGITPIGVQEPQTEKYDRFFIHDSAQHILIFKYLLRPIEEHRISHLGHRFLEQGKKVVLISNVKLTEGALRVADKYKDLLTVISFGNEEDLKNQLIAKFSQDKSGDSN